MTAQELLADLTHRNVVVTIDGERLRIDAPRGVFTEELRRMLSERKSELVELIRRRSAGEADGKAAERAERQRVAAMPLDDFATAGLTVRVWSNILGCEVLFVSDNVPDAELEGTDLPIYRTDELRKLVLLRPRPRELRRIHDVKNIFEGAITDVQPRDDDSDRREAAASSKGARAHCGKARASIRSTLPGQAVG